LKTLFSKVNHMMAGRKSNLRPFEMGEEKKQKDAPFNTSLFGLNSSCYKKGTGPTPDSIFGGEAPYDGGKGGLGGYKPSEGPNYLR